MLLCTLAVVDLNIWCLQQARRQEAMWRGRLAEVQRGHDQVTGALV